MQRQEPYHLKEAGECSGSVGNRVEPEVISLCIHCNDMDSSYLNTPHSTVVLMFKASS